MIRIFLSDLYRPIPHWGQNFPMTIMNGLLYKDKDDIFSNRLFLFSVAGMAIFFRPTPQFPTGQLNPASYSSWVLFFYTDMIFRLVCYFTTKKYMPNLPKWDPNGFDKVGFFQIDF